MVSTAKKFRTDVLSGTFGTILAYALGLLFLPLITRYYKPEHIGSWQILLAVISLITPLATLLFESAIVLEKSKRIISNLLIVVILNTLIICIAIILVTLFYSNVLDNLLNIEALPIHAGWLILFGVLIQVSFLMISALIVKQKKFKSQAISKVLGSLLIPLVAVSALLFYNASHTLYIIAALSGVMVQVLFLYKSIDRKYFINILDWDKKKLHSAIIKYKVYPIYMVPYALSQGAVWQITLMSLGILFSTSIVGAYTVARQLVYMPVSLLTASLKQVIFSYASTAPLYDKSVNNRVSKLLVNIVNIAIPFAVFGFFYLPDIINFALGKSWENVGIFSRWILISAIALMLTSWLDRLFDVYGRQRLAVFLQISSDIVFLLVLLICYLLKVDSLITVISLSLFLATYNLIWLYIVLAIIGHKPSIWLMLMARLFIIAIVAFSVIKLLEIALPLNLALLVEGLILLTTIYYTYVKIRINNEK